MLACRDMGMNCDFVANGDTNEEVMKQLSEHGMTVHAEEIQKMNMPKDEMMKMMMSNIKEA